MLNTLNIVAAESEVNTLLVGPSNEEIKAITLFASFQPVGTRGNFKLNLELFSSYLGGSTTCLKLDAQRPFIPIPADSRGTGNEAI